MELEYKKLNTYPEMNETIKDLLIIQDDEISLYAVNRIIELENELKLKNQNG